MLYFNKLKIILLIIMISLGLSCSKTSVCNFGSECQKRNSEILLIVLEINKINESTDCEKPIDDEIRRILQKKVDQIESPQELAILASVLRSFLIYQNDAPSCKVTRTGNVNDIAFWFCIKKLSTNPTKENISLLNSIKNNSSFDAPENAYFQSLMGGPPFP